MHELTNRQLKRIRNRCYNRLAPANAAMAVIANEAERVDAGAAAEVRTMIADLTTLVGKLDGRVASMLAARF